MNLFMLAEHYWRRRQAAQTETLKVLNAFLICSDRRKLPGTCELKVFGYANATGQKYEIIENFPTDREWNMETWRNVMEATVDRLHAKAHLAQAAADEVGGIEACDVHPDERTVKRGGSDQTIEIISSIPTLKENNG